MTEPLFNTYLKESFDNDVIICSASSNSKLACCYIFQWKDKKKIFKNLQTSLFHTRTVHIVTMAVEVQVMLIWK